MHKKKTKTKKQKKTLALADPPHPKIQCFIKYILYSLCIVIIVFHMSADSPLDQEAVYFVWKLHKQTSLGRKLLAHSPDYKI